ncbi:hypothetical protein M408DRAFT_329889 [Serendipita vermifera MAFF 305830]|uniref:Uncharacterized protein n=1 Tax=Serendipita vermifera MAFF 305830 TaxID=933852 RepID=A0A0C3B8D2_SERVB|nr:hypothetical protein M408DRAFT_329889 [Serendipita vermifera MAFF 305830]
MALRKQATGKGSSIQILGLLAPSGTRKSSAFSFRIENLWVSESKNRGFESVRGLGFDESRCRHGDSNLISLLECGLVNAIIINIVKRGY